MVCPQCNGKRFSEVLGMSEVFCPTCEGLGELPDVPALNHCPACGKPIREDQRWCDEHKEAERFEALTTKVEA
jgi:NMD protein affecting ribosome stability and mRNA decay